MLHKHYGKGFEVVEQLPLPIVVKMLYHAIKKETEQQVYPLWLVHVIVAKMTGGEIIPIDEMIGTQQEKSTRSADEILKEFANIVEIDKKRGGV